MIDKLIQPFTQPILVIVSKILLKFITPNQMSLMGFIVGVFMCLFIFTDMYFLALIALFINRLFDGLDGTMARLTAPSAFGGYIDIIFDFLIYAGFVLSFGLTDHSNLISSSILIFLYIGTGSTFLAYAAILKNMNRPSKKEINKSFFYASGLIEGFETIIFMVLSLLFPNFFILIASIFSLLCSITIVGRIFYSYKEFN